MYFPDDSVMWGGSCASQAGGHHEILRKPYRLQCSPPCRSNWYKACAENKGPTLDSRKLERLAVEARLGDRKSFRSEARLERLSSFTVSDGRWLSSKAAGLATAQDDSLG